MQAVSDNEWYGHSWRRGMRRTGLAAVLGMGLFVGGQDLLAQSKAPARQPAAAAPKEDPDRAKWEARITFFGEEETNLISLRILDRDAVEEGDFALRSLWKFDVDKNAWAEVQLPKQVVRIRTKDRKPEGSPPDSQVLADLGIKVQDVGLYYVHWSVDGVKGSTYLRLGPQAQSRKPPGAAGPGQKIEDVPVNIDNAKLMVIPDPQYHTGPDCPPVPK
jgi:hypothetical protein